MQRSKWWFPIIVCIVLLIGSVIAAVSAFPDASPVLPAYTRILDGTTQIAAAVTGSNELKTSNRGQTTNGASSLPMKCNADIDNTTCHTVVDIAASANGVIYNTVQNSASLAAAPVACDKSVAVSVTSATTTQLIAINGSMAIYVCGYSISSVGGTSTLEYGTGTTCGTGTTTLTGPYPAGSTINYGTGYGTVTKAPSGNALCIVSGTSTTATAGVVSYAQF